jgi:hypothetical protein
MSMAYTYRVVRAGTPRSEVPISLCLLPYAYISALCLLPTCLPYALCLHVCLMLYAYISAAGGGSCCAGTPRSGALSSLCLMPTCLPNALCLHICGRRRRQLRRNSGHRSERRTARPLGSYAQALHMSPYALCLHI